MPRHLRAIAAALLVFTCAHEAQAGAQVIITPPRAELPPEGSSGRFMLVNKGDAPARYEISATALLEHEAYALDLCPSVIFSPKAVTVAPGATQVVRYLVTVPHTGVTGPFGEERCRLAFKAVALPPSDASASASENAGAVINLLISFTVAIIRHAPPMLPEIEEPAPTWN